MILELNGLCCGYDGKAIIKNITETIYPGEICCILGENGVGKSTLFRTLLKLIPPVAGSISIDGINLSEWSHKRLSKKMAYVAQSHTPSFAYTVEEIILMGRLGQIGAFSTPSKKDREIVDAIIHRLQLEKYRSRDYSKHPVGRQGGT